MAWVHIHLKVSQTFNAVQAIIFGGRSKKMKLVNFLSVVVDAE